MSPTPGSLEGRNWLGFGQRASRAHSVANPPTPSLVTTQSDMGPVPGTAERRLQRSFTLVPSHQPAHKHARLSRFSTYIGLANPAKSHADNAMNMLTPEQIMERSESMSSRATEYHDVPHDTASGIWRAKPDSDGSYMFRASDQTWHNPNITQMMDTVSSAIMSNGVSETIPRHLNGFVIGMIEEYRVHLGKMSTLEGKYEDLRTTRKKETLEFAGMADEWKLRESGFKAEVKRLEQIIAERDGTHSVVVARAGSMYNRNDAKAFQAKLNRLSKNDDELDNVQQVAMEGEMRNFAVLPDMRDSDREVVLDHNSDTLMSELYLPGAKTANEHKLSPRCLSKRMAAAQQFLDQNGRPCLPSNNASKATSPRKSNSTAPSSDVPSSASSSQLAQAVLGAAATADYMITPHTSPSRPEPVKPCLSASLVRASTGTNALLTIQEMARMNGGLPEDAIEDESSYAGSFVPSQRTRTDLPDNGNAKRDNGGSKHMGTQRSRLLSLKEAPSHLINGFDIQSISDQRAQVSKECHSSSSSGSSASSSRSATLEAMAHNCIDHAGQSGTTDCPRNSPAKKVQSGADPVPDDATKQRFRTDRTVLNAHFREHSHMSNQELRGAMDDRNYKWLHQQKGPTQLAHKDFNPPRKARDQHQQHGADDRRVLLPHGFEAHATTGLLPFQQAATQRADRASTVKQAAAEMNEAIQKNASAVERKLVEASEKA